MIDMIRAYDGMCVPKECCTFTNPRTSGGKSEIDDIDLPCGADCENSCSSCVIQKIMDEYAELTGQAENTQGMNIDRARNLIASLVELVRANRQDIYNQEFAAYLMKEVGITKEELLECGAYGEEAEE